MLKEVTGDNHALQALKHELQAHQVKRVAPSRLPTAVGGFEWDKVSSLLQQALKDVTILIYIYRLYKKGVAAQEG